MSEREDVRIERGPGRCAYCHDEVPRDERTACAACLGVHHDGCWREHGRCATCGEGEALTRAGAGEPTLAGGAGPGEPPRLEGRPVAP
jgi:hypothetical protein